MADKRFGCEYKSVSTAAGAGVVVSTGPAWLYGLSVYTKTTGGMHVVLYDATATATGTFLIGCAADTSAGAVNDAFFAAPVHATVGIYASVVAGTAASDFGTVGFIKDKV